MSHSGGVASYAVRRGELADYHDSIGCGNTRCIPHSWSGLCLDCLWGEVLGPIDEAEMSRVLDYFLSEPDWFVEECGRVGDQLNGTHGEVTGSDDVRWFDWWVTPRSGEQYWGFGRFSFTPSVVVKTKPLEVDFVELYGGAGGNSFISSKVKNVGAGKGSKQKKDALPPKDFKPKKDVEASPPQKEKEEKPKFVGPIPFAGGPDRAGGLGTVGGLAKFASSLASRLEGAKFAALPKGPTSFEKGLLLMPVGEQVLKGSFLPDEVLSRYSKGSLENSKLKDRHIVTSLVTKLSESELYDVYDPGEGSMGLCGLAAVSAGANRKLDSKELQSLVANEVTLRCHDPNLREGVGGSDPNKLFSSYWERAGLVIPPDASYDTLVLWLATTFGSESWLGAYANSLRVNLLVLDEDWLVHSMWVADSDWDTVVIRYRSNGGGLPGHWLLVRPRGSKADVTHSNLPSSMKRSLLLSEALPALQELFLDEKVVARPVGLATSLSRGCGFEPVVEFELEMKPFRLNDTSSYLPLRLQNDQQDITDSTYECVLSFSEAYVELLDADDVSTRRKGLAGFCDGLARGCRRAWKGRPHRKAKKQVRFQLSKALFGAFTESYFRTLSVKNGDRSAALDAGMVAVLAVRGVNYDQVAQRRNFMFGGLIKLFGPSQFLMSRDLKHEALPISVDREKETVLRLVNGAPEMESLKLAREEQLFRLLRREELPNSLGSLPFQMPTLGVNLVVDRRVRGVEESKGDEESDQGGELPPVVFVPVQVPVRGRGLLANVRARGRGRAPSRAKKKNSGGGGSLELVGGLIVNRPRLMGIGDPKAYVGGKYGDKTADLQASNYALEKGSRIVAIKKGAEKELPNKQAVVAVFPLGVPNVEGADLGAGLYPAPSSTTETVKAFISRGLVEDFPYTKLPDFEYFAEKMVHKMIGEVSTRLADLGPEPDPVEEYRRIAKGKRTQAQIDKNVDLYRRFGEGTLTKREEAEFSRNSCFLKAESNTKLRDFRVVDGKPRLICTMSVRETINCSRLVKIMEVFEHGIMGDYMVSGLNSKELAETLGEASLGRIVATDYSSWEATATSRVANMTENALLTEALKVAGWYDTLEEFQRTIKTDQRKVYAKNVSILIDGRHSGKYITYFANCLLNMMVYWWNVICVMADERKISLREATDEFISNRPIDKCKPVFSGDDGLVPQGVMSVEVCRDLGALFSVDYATFEPGMGPFCSTYAVDGLLYGPVANVCLKLLAVKKGLGLKPGKVKFLMRMAAYSAHLKYGDHPVIGAMVVAIGKATAGVSAFADWAKYTDYWKGDAPDPEAVIRDFPREWKGCSLERRAVVARGGIERTPVDYARQILVEDYFLNFDWSAFVLLSDDPAVAVAKACGPFLDGCDGHGAYRHETSKLDDVREIYSQFGRLMPEPAVNTPFIPEWDGRTNPVAFFAALR